MVKRKIGLAGRSGSGKDVVADYISERFGYTKIAVADAIRDEVQGFLLDSLESRASNEGLDLPSSFRIVLDAFKEAVWAKPTTPEMRVLLQWWGTEYRRSYDSNYWVKRLEERIPEEAFIVISDVRLPIEMETIRKAGGEIWFVERPGIGNVGITNHLTEIGLDGATFDRTIRNDGTLDDLRKSVEWIFREC